MIARVSNCLCFREDDLCDFFVSLRVEFDFEGSGCGFGEEINRWWFDLRGFCGWVLRFEEIGCFWGFMYKISEFVLLMALGMCFRSMIFISRSLFSELSFLFVGLREVLIDQSMGG